jgi:hypothetical protein
MVSDVIWIRCQDSPVALGWVRRLSNCADSAHSAHRACAEGRTHAYNGAAQ